MAPKTSWQHRDPEYRLKVLHHAFVERPIGVGLIADMDRARRNQRIGAEPTCIAVTGDTGVGKSELLKHYRDANLADPVEAEGIRQTIRPVLYVEFPSDLTVAMAGDEVLRALLGPRANIQRRQQNALIPFHLAQQKVELIIFDEFQHVAEKGADKTRAATADWVKHLTKTTKIPVVMAGMPALLTLVEGNAQLSSITPYRHHLTQFAFHATGEKNAFRKFLADLDQLLPFDELCRFGDPGMASLLFRASNGVLRPLCQLLRVAGEYAIDAGSSFIQLGHLHQAFEEVGCHPSCGANPFVDRLDEAA